MKLKQSSFINYLGVVAWSFVILIGMSFCNVDDWKVVVEKEVDVEEETVDEVEVV